MAALKGRIAYLPLDVAANATFVPDKLFDTDSLVLLIGGQPTHTNKIWTSLVDIGKIHRALAWLRENNELYKDVPCYTVSEIQQIIDEKIKKNSSTECDSEPDGTILKRLDEVSRSFLYENFTIQPLNTDIPADIVMDYQMDKVHGQSANVFDNYTDVKAFPELFPRGRFGMKDMRRKNKIGTSDYIKSRLLNQDPKFRLNINYLFHCFQVQEVSNMCNSIGHMLRSVTGKSLSAKAFHDRLQSRDGEIQNNMFSMMAKVRGTKEFFAQRGMEVKWMIKELGPPTLFLTCSCAEWLSEPFIDHLRTINASIPGVDKMTAAELCAMDPVHVSIHFHKKWEAIFSKLIKAKEDPIFGEVSDHFWRIEYQNRGAAHVHCVLWIKDAPVIGRNSPEEIEAYIKKICTCSKPDPNESPTLHDLVERCQVHKCNRYCTKTYKHSGKFYKKCRFGFPRPQKSRLEINDVIDCLAVDTSKQPRKRLYNLARKDDEEYINDYNPALLLANESNIDVQYIGHLGSRLPYYITEYMTKYERAEQDDLWKDIFTTGKSLGSRAMSFMLKSVKSGRLVPMKQQIAC